MHKLPINLSSSRSGFMILMLIAFTSIILGLSVTFYVYCKRGMDDSSVAVRLANQRLAFAGALSYVAGRTLASPGAVTPTFYASSGDLNRISLQDSSLNRTKRLGWFRVAYADQTYLGTMTVPAGTDRTRCLFVTTGVGPSGGTLSPLSQTNWAYEMRAWYLVEMNGTPLCTVKRCINIFPPPQSGGTIFW